MAKLIFLRSSYVAQVAGQLAQYPDTTITRVKGFVLNGHLSISLTTDVQCYGALTDLI